MWNQFNRFLNYFWRNTIQIYLLPTWFWSFLVNIKSVSQTNSFDLYWLLSAFSLVSLQTWIVSSIFLNTKLPRRKEPIITLVLAVTLRKQIYDMIEVFHSDEKSACDTFYMFIPEPVFYSLVKPLIYWLRQL